MSIKIVKADKDRRFK